MPDEADSTQILRKAQASGRRLIIEGDAWLVYQLPAMQFDRRHTASLVFESDATVRRVRNFPANWRELTDDELFAVSWGA